MKDSTHRTLNYVEVVYLNDNAKPHSVRHVHYPEAEAERMYNRTIDKFKKENRSALIILREENHTLIKSEKVNF